MPLPMYADLVLGIDGGGSHTVVLLAERQTDGRVLGRGQVGPSNQQSIGEAAALQALEDGIHAAFAEANLPRGTVAAAALGLAGVDHPATAQLFLNWADRFQFATKTTIHNDAVILLAAGTPAGWGVAVVAGTGSIAFSRSPDGRFDRSGGWGYLLGDEGSAYALALAGMRAVCRAADGCALATKLTRAILAQMDLREPLEIINAVYLGAWDRARLAMLAPVVLTTAEEGDEVAVQIVKQQARELAQTTVAAARKLNLPLDRIPLALTGGAILNGRSYREQFLAELRTLGLRAEPVALVTEPALGAVRIARDLLGTSNH
jgi:N-acetylglucosamine kinase-like BadF-type ATPase